MSTVSYLSKKEMEDKFGMDALGYTDNGQIYLQKGMDKETENIVRAHEADHVKNGESGPFLGPILGGLSNVLGLGGDTKAPGEAAALQSQAAKESAALQSAAFQKILPMLQQQLGTTQQAFDPFIQAGVGALPGLTAGFQAPEGTTAGGLDAVLNQIMGGEAFGGLVEERQRGIQGQLAAGGLTRSGRAVEEAAAVPTDLAFQLENMLFGRQAGAEQQRIAGLESLVGGGRAATGAAVGAGGDIMAQIMNAILGEAGATGGGITGSAAAEASGILGTAEAEQAGIQNILNLGGTLGAGYLSKPAAPVPK